MQNHVIFLMNFADELRRKGPMRKQRHAPITVQIHYRRCSRSGVTPCRSGARDCCTWRNPHLGNERGPNTAVCWKKCRCTNFGKPANKPRQRSPGNCEWDRAMYPKLERRTDVYVSTLARYLQAVGADLEIRAVVPDGRAVKITQFSE